jgi:hypothetical protein
MVFRVSPLVGSQQPLAQQSFPPAGHQLIGTMSTLPPHAPPAWPEQSTIGTVPWQLPWEI